MNYQCTRHQKPKLREGVQSFSAPFDVHRQLSLRPKLRSPRILRKEEAVRKKKAITSGLLIEDHSVMFFLAQSLVLSSSPEGDSLILSFANTKATYWFRIVPRYKLAKYEYPFFPLKSSSQKWTLHVG